MTFDVKTLIGDTSLSNKRTDPKKIYYKDLCANPDNFFRIEDVEALADSIENVGLMTPLTVIRNDEGLYTLISGHRRLEAIKILVEERGYEQFEEVPCVVLADDTPEYILDMMLIETNTEVRELSDGEKLEAAERLKKDYEAAREAGRPFVGKVREFIGKQLKISPRQAQKYVTINNNASDEIKQGVKDGTITLNEAFNEVKQQKPMSSAEITQKMDEIDSEVDELNRNIESADGSRRASDYDDYDDDGEDELYEPLTREERNENTGYGDWSSRTRDDVTDPEAKTVYGAREIDRITGSDKPEAQHPDRDPDEPEDMQEARMLARKGLSNLKVANITLLDDELSEIIQQLEEILN